VCVQFFLYTSAAQQIFFLVRNWIPSFHFAASIVKLREIPFNAHFSWGKILRWVSIFRFPSGVLYSLAIFFCGFCKLKRVATPTHTHPHSHPHPPPTRQHCTEVKWNSIRTFASNKKATRSKKIKAFSGRNSISKELFSCFHCPPARKPFSLCVSPPTLFSISLCFPFSLPFFSDFLVSCLRFFLSSFRAYCWVLLSIKFVCSSRRKANCISTIFFPPNQIASH